jgi:SAM-dependent methyltransferase
VSENEDRLVRWHAEHAGAFAQALARSGSYQRLAACAPRHGRVLDLGCGSGELLGRLGAHAVGCDVSPHELRLATRVGCVARARAQALPFAAGAFDAVVSHLAFSLFDDIERVVGELARVIARGGAFHALLGGGPTADGDDAFHRFLRVAARAVADAPRFGDARARSEHGWRALFDAGAWELAPFVRCEFDLGGSCDDVWRYFAASYIPHASDVYDAWRAVTRDLIDTHNRVPCRIVCWLGSARRR